MSKDVRNVYELMTEWSDVHEGAKPRWPENLTSVGKVKGIPIFSTSEPSGYRTLIDLRRLKLWLTALTPDQAAAVKKIIIAAPGYIWDNDMKLAAAVLPQNVIFLGQYKGEEPDIMLLMALQHEIGHCVAGGSELAADGVARQINMAYRQWRREAKASGQQLPPV